MPWLLPFVAHDRNPHILILSHSIFLHHYHYHHHINGYSDSILLTDTLVVFSRHRCLAANASPPTVARSATKSPLDNLPWNKRRVEQREARRIRREAAKLYRELGIAEDSTYEEIVQQTDKLKAQAKDFKEQVRIDLGKDKILEMRLSERIAGLAKVSDEVRSQDTYDSEG